MKKILLIEDNNEIRENMTEILDLAGYEVHTSENGMEGVALAIKEKTDLNIACGFSDNNYNICPKGITFSIEIWFESRRKHLTS